MQELKDLIRNIPDFPKKGINFKDITPLLQSGEGLKKTIDILVERYKDQDIDCVVGIESRGFIFGTPLAYGIGVGFVPIRKPGKLPYDKVAVSYELEYGSDQVEMHKDAIQKNSRILIVDDLLATGGTAKASAELVEKVGGKIVDIAFLIELEFLNGKEKLKDYNYYSMLKF